MFTVSQLLAHGVGDYILQSDWMAKSKARSSIACLSHVATYGLPFLFLRPSIAAYLVIVGSHFVIDRYRLARHLVRFKNLLAPPAEARRAWRTAQDSTGYPDGTPAFLSVWLLIIADNILHVLINGLALHYL